MQRMIVRNFGPIREAEIELDRLTILIGPNGSGKTLLAKLAFFFNLFPDWIYEQWVRPMRSSHVEEPQQRLQHTVVADLLQKGIPTLFRSYFGSKEYLTQETTIEFVWDSGVAVKMVVKDGLFLVQIVGSEVLKNALEKIWEDVSKLPDFILEKNVAKEKVVQQQLFDLFYHSSKRQFVRYLPEIRAAYWNLMNKYLRDSAETVWLNEIGEDREGNTEDVLLTRYLIQRRRASIQFRQSFEDRELKLQQDVALGIRLQQEVDVLIKLEQAFQHLSGGKLVVDPYGNEELVLDSGLRLPMKQTSSGQRDISGLFPVLYHDLWLGSSAFYAIEEPESHLYPLTQKGLVELLAMFLNASGPETRMVLTTHSPYVLTSINNLLFAHKVGQQPELSNEVDQELSRDYWMDPAKMTVYYLDQSGAFSLMTENGVINAESIDSVSDEIGDKFDALMAVYRKRVVHGGA